MYAADGPGHEHHPRGWRRRGASGALAASVFLGLREALEDHDGDEPAWFEDASGDGHEEPVSVYLHPEVPEATLVVLRPWAR